MRSVLLLALLWLNQSSLAAESSDIKQYYELTEIQLPEGELSVDAVAVRPDGKLFCAVSLSKIYVYDPERESWQLFASGLQTPLGLVAVSNSEVIVGQRPELTHIKDLDGDGRADRFETVTDYWGLSGNYGDWTFGPARDSEGNLFIGLGSGSMYGEIPTTEVRGEFSLAGHRGRMNSSVPYRGWILKVTPEGELIPYASGIRQPNAPGFDAQGNLLVPDNQGDWVGSTHIYHVQEGEFYGWVPALAWSPGITESPQTIAINDLFRMRTPPVVTIPYGDMSNSATQLVTDTTEGKFGPFAGQVFIGEMNHSRIMRLMLEEVGGQLQGAVIDFFHDPALGLGNNRLAFDGDSLWVGQTLQGFWVGSSGLKKITWKQVTPPEVRAINLTETGFRLTFTKPIDAGTLSDPATMQVSSYFYNYHPQYGSNKFELRTVPVKAIQVAQDGRQVSIELEELIPWRLYDITLPRVADVDGNLVPNRRIVYTLNHLLGAKTPPQPLPVVTSEPEMRHPAVPAGLRSIGGPQNVSDVIPELEVLPTRPQDPTGQRFSDDPPPDAPIDGYDIRENGKLVLHYNVAPVSLPDGTFKRAHYIHPLYGFDGTLMTHDLVQDHPHHRGLFWAWPQLWLGDTKIGRPWEQIGVEWTVNNVETHSEDDKAILQSQVSWNTPEVLDQGEPAVLIEEQARITVHRSADHYRILDFEIALTALKENVRIGGSEDKKGYGGFSIRIPLPEDLRITDAEGREAAVNWLAPSPATGWQNYHGSFSPEKKSAIAILSHEQNPGHPPGWTTRIENSAQNPVFPGGQPIPLSQEEPLVLKYRVVLQRSRLTDEQIEELYREFQSF